MYRLPGSSCRFLGISCLRNSLGNTDVLHTSEKSTTFLSLFILLKTKPVKTVNSIAIDCPILLFDEFTGWVDLESGLLIIFLSLATDRSDSVRVIRSHFHWVILTLCIFGKLPIVFMPLRLVTRGGVRVVVFTRDFVKTSGGVFVPSDGLLRFSTRIAHLEPLED